MAFIKRRVILTYRAFSDLGFWIIRTLLLPILHQKRNTFFLWHAMQRILWNTTSELLIRTQMTALVYSKPRARKKPDW